jgi:hypothetical protein
MQNDLYLVGFTSPTKRKVEVVIAIDDPTTIPTFIKSELKLELPKTYHLSKIGEHVSNDNWATAITA